MLDEVTVRRVKIEPFEMERWQSLHENDVELNLSDSGVHPLSLGELVEFLDGDSSLEELLGQPLLGKAYLLFFPTGAQSPKDHVTIDQFDCDVAGDFEQVARIVQNIVAPLLSQTRIFV